MIWVGMEARERMGAREEGLELGSLEEGVERERSRRWSIARD